MHVQTDNMQRNRDRLYMNHRHIKSDRTTYRSVSRSAQHAGLDISLWLAPTPPTLKTTRDCPGRTGPSSLEPIPVTAITSPLTAACRGHGYNSAPSINCDGAIRGILNGATSFDTHPRPFSKHGKPTTGGVFFF